MRRSASLPAYSTRRSSARTATCQGCDDQELKLPCEFLRWGSYDCGVLILFRSWRTSSMADTSASTLTCLCYMVDGKDGIRTRECAWCSWFLHSPGLSTSQTSPLSPTQMASLTSSTSSRAPTSSSLNKHVSFSGSARSCSSRTRARQGRCHQLFSGGASRSRPLVRGVHREHDVQGRQAVGALRELHEGRLAPYLSRPSYSCRSTSALVPRLRLSCFVVKGMCQE